MGGLSFESAKHGCLFHVNLDTLNLQQKFNKSQKQSDIFLESLANVEYAAVRSSTRAPVPLKDILNK